jgi:hypothetical protein
MMNTLFAAEVISKAGRSGTIQTLDGLLDIDDARKHHHRIEVHSRTDDPALDTKVNPQPPLQPVSERFAALEEREMILTFFAPEGREVHVAGDFNGWRPEVTPLKNTGAGEWTVRLKLRSGQYEYRFVVDGRWREDPLAFQRVANPYGNFNCVLRVPPAVRTFVE